MAAPNCKPVSSFAVLAHGKGSTKSPASDRAQHANRQQEDRAHQCHYANNGNADQRGRAAARATPADRAQGPPAPGASRARDRMQKRRNFTMGCSAPIQRGVLSLYRYEECAQSSFQCSLAFLFERCILQARRALRVADLALAAVALAAPDGGFLPFAFCPGKRRLHFLRQALEDERVGAPAVHPHIRAAATRSTARP